MPAKAQQVKAWVFFTDKENTAFDAQAYFSPENLQRKQLQNLPAYDHHDLPVNPQYASAIDPLCDSITYLSRWLNAACVYTNPEQLEAIQRFAFVRSVEITYLEPTLMDNKTTIKELHQGEINLLRMQTGRMQGNVFRKNGITGKNVTIAIIDGGFKGYTRNPVLRRAIDRGQVKHTYDFIKKRKDVDAGSSHGTAVLSCITGYLDDSLEMGCAPEANILLYRTEKAFNEKLNEEEYWMAAMEEADRQGADLINTSLGYSTRRYFQQDMNGRKSILARAANIAAKKGVLVICSAGNEGDISWKTICTPADADSALAVGAINPWTGIQASWSSYGPSADGRIKPNVSAFGYAMTAMGSKGVEANTGTSFSSPLVTGFAACVKQKFPQLTAVELMQKIENACDLYPYFDYAHGYGVPQASHILASDSTTAAETFEVEMTNDSLKITIAEKFFQPAYLQVTGYYTSPDDTAKLYTEVEGEDLLRSVHFYDGIYGSPRVSYLFGREPGYFYYKVNDEEAERIAEYAVLNVRQRLVFKTARSGRKNYTFHYKGYTKTVAF